MSYFGCRISGKPVFPDIRFFFFASLFFGMAHAEPEQVAVLANANNTNSLSLAEYYMQQRGIPTNHLFILNVPDREEISRKEYDTRIRAPLIKQLESRGLLTRTKKIAALRKKEKTGWKNESCDIKYLVSIYGMPLRIRDTDSRFEHAVKERLGLEHERDVAAVDSELSFLLQGDYSIKGNQQNPFYNQFYVAKPGRSMGFLLFATRLDGPSPHLVREIIDQSIQAEKYGIPGRVFVDTQGLKKGGYVEGDYWLIDASERLKREGYECYRNNHPETYPSSFPMEDVGMYYGWYAPDVNGPFLRKKFSFLSGAIAYHLHSFSAQTLRSTKKRWTGPLLARGATASMGSVYEPYLSMTCNIHIFVDRLCRRYTFGEAAAMSLRYYSWQMTLVGDPMYQPFKHDIETQIRHMEEDEHPHLEWGYLRKVNLLAREGRFNMALQFCRKKIKQTQSLVLREKLGDIYAQNQLLEESGEQYRLIMNQDLSQETLARVGAKLLYVLQLLKQTEQVISLKKAIKKAMPEDSPFLDWVGVETP